MQAKPPRSSTESRPTDGECSWLPICAQSDPSLGSPAGARRSVAVFGLSPLTAYPPPTPLPTYLVSRDLPIPSTPPSRPNPDCLTPPKGAAELETTPWFNPIIPVSIPSHTRNARPRSRVYT